MKSKSKTTQLLGKIENGTEVEAYEAAKVISNLQGNERRGHESGTSSADYVSN